MTPQTIHMLVYKNAIANGLRTTKKLTIQNVKQFDDMVKYNDNPMNSNFWHLFTQLIFQFAQIHKDTNIAMPEWERHFNKLQHGLTLNEDSPDVTDTSENENCNKKLMQDDAGSSQHRFPHETINTAGKTKSEPQIKCQSFCLCSYEDIWDSEKKNYEARNVEKM